MDCFIRCLAPVQGQGHSLPEPKMTHAAKVAAEARRVATPSKKPEIVAPLSELAIEDIGKPSSPIGLKMRQLQQSGGKPNAPNAPSTRSGSTWTSKSSGVSQTFRGDAPLKANAAAASSVFTGSGYMAATNSKQNALAAAKSAEMLARAAEERAAKAMADASKRGMHFAMHVPGNQPHSRSSSPNVAARTKALEAARAAAVAAKLDGGIKPGVQQPHKPRHVSPANSRRNTPVHSRSSSPANSHRGISSRPYKPTIPLDGAPPPSFMAATKAVSVVPVRQSADGGAVATDGAARIAPGETGRLNLERMRWDEKYA